MVDVSEYLRMNSKEIVDFINSKYIPDEITMHKAFDNLATLLQKAFVTEKDRQLGVRDQAHNVLAMATICSLWCGWITQAKANSRPQYVKNTPELFKHVISDAFDIGQQYSKVQP